LDALVNNAALWTTTECKKSYHDIQDSMMVNHISPFVFTQTLLPLMKETAEERGSDVRIVVLSSRAIFFVPKGVRFRNKDDFNRDYADMRMAFFKRYGMSKLANSLYARQLQKNLDEEGSSIIVTHVHPGRVNTSSNSKLEVSEGNSALVSSISSVTGTLWLAVTRTFFSDMSTGAYTSVFAAGSPEVRENAEKYKGAYLVPIAQVAQASEDALDDKLAVELWETTERILQEIGV